VRQHKQTPFKPLSEIKFIGESDTGKVYEQEILLTWEGEQLKARRIIVKLNNPTTDGEMEISIFCNLPVEDANAIKVAEIYRERWAALLRCSS